MTGIPFFCGDERRRIEVAANDEVVGIDFLEVLDDPTQPPSDRQRILFVHFIHDPSPLGLGRDNVVVEGGERVRGLRVLSADVAVDARSGSAEPVLVAAVDRPGDFSTYTLRLEPSATSPLTGLDPVLRAVDFSFKVDCETRFDPLQPGTCVAGARTEPALDYLARDYPSLRQLVLDRMAVLVPGWQERNPADIGMALVELLAYVGDQLSYRQDAVATEAYLATCRLRTSARRHARLVDYTMHDGCNARAWIQVRVADGVGPFELTGATFFGAVAGLPSRILPGSPDHARARASEVIAFEQMGTATLAARHNRIPFYSWGERECCLPKGAVRATLRGALTDLRPGAVLVLVEERGPGSGQPADADVAHRHAVLLTEVRQSSDPIGGRFDLPPTDDAVPVTEVRWADDDALPFPLCISADAAAEHGGAFLPEVSVALGNIVQADHGAAVKEPLETATGRFHPRLAAMPITQTGPAVHDAVAAVELHDEAGNAWEARGDLLRSGPVDPHFVVEVETDGRARLRFGDGVHGRRPGAGVRFTARYRVGNGPAGNVGAGALAHVVTAHGGVVGATNALPGTGGADMETIEEVRQRAPVAFRRVLKRAVTPADYATVAGEHPGVQRATATMRWTGSWRTVSLAVDRLGGLPVTDDFIRSIHTYMDRYRMAGHDLEIDPPVYVALEIAMSVHVARGYFVSHVRRALLDVFSDRRLADGGVGLFHPDNLTFGQVVYLGPVYAAAHAVEGVESVDVTVFQRRDQPGRTALDEGRLTFGRLEIARLENDPNHPERGTLLLRMEGGR